MKNKILTTILIVTLLLTLPALALAADKGKGKVTIRVGHFPNITHSQALLGLANGAFQKALGNKVVIKRTAFNAGPAEIEALVAGEIDLGYIGPVPAINGFVKSEGGLKIIAGATNAGAVLVVRKDTTIKSVKDLAGKIVAVPQYGNTQDISLRNLLQQAKLKSVDKGGKVTVLQADNPDILTLFIRKQIDAALVPEPWGARLVKDGNARILLDEKQVWRNGAYTTAVVIVRTDFLKKNPDLVEKWLQTHVELTQQIKSSPENTKKLINQEIKALAGKNIPEDLLKTAYARIIPTVDPTKDSISEFIKISKNAGYLKIKPKVEQLVDLRLLNKVLKAQKLPEIK